MDKLQAMEVFMQVVDAGGFTRAAVQAFVEWVSELFASDGRLNAS